MDLRLWNDLPPAPRCGCEAGVMVHAAGTLYALVSRKGETMVRPKDRQVSSIRQHLQGPVRQMKRRIEERVPLHKLVVMAVTLALSIFCSHLCVCAAEKDAKPPLKVGLVYSTSGALGFLGNNVVTGHKMAIDDISKSGG